MFDLRKFKRYKIRRLYVCQVALAINKQPSEYKVNWTQRTLSTEILYSTLFPGYFIDPLTRQLYVVENKVHFNTKNEFYVEKVLGGINNFLYISDDIYSRGDYLKLQELIDFHKQLKQKTK